MFWRSPAGYALSRQNLRIALMARLSAQRVSGRFLLYSTKILSTLDLTAKYRKILGRHYSGKVALFRKSFEDSRVSALASRCAFPFWASGLRRINAKPKIRVLLRYPCVARYKA